MLTSPLNSMLTSFYSGSHSYNSGGDRSLSTPILVEENKNYGLPEFHWLLEFIEKAKFTKKSLLN